MDEHSTSNYGNENFDLAKQSVLTSCVSSNTFTKLNEQSPLMATLAKINDQSSVMGSLTSLMTANNEQQQQRTDFQIQKKKDKAGGSETSKVDYQPARKKRNKNSDKSSNSKEENTLVLDANININMCSHCSRVFCTKRALDVHTFKMHGKEYLQKSQTRTSTPFNCWFCSANFQSPEQVVEHMTNAHENLDSLSKRVEEQGRLSSTQTKLSISSPKALNNKFISVVQQKQMIPFAQLNAGLANAGAAPQPVSDTSVQPPRGFKVSYALAYVPIYIPERNEKGGTNEEKKE